MYLSDHKKLRKHKFILTMLSLFISCDLLAEGSCLNENTSIPFSTPSTAFTINGNGTVTHEASGLMWMQCSLGQLWINNSCSGNASFFRWKSALNFADTYIFAGFDDWRLPTKNELASIVEERCFEPAVNNDVFPATPSNWYFTSSSSSSGGLFVWSISSRSGVVSRYGVKGQDGVSVVSLVRLVRTK